MESILSYLNKSTIDRFWGNVNKTNYCWEWTLTKTADGYGVLYLGRKSDGKNIAHEPTEYLT